MFLSDCKYWVFQSSDCQSILLIKLLLLSYYYLLTFEHKNNQLVKGLRSFLMLFSFNRVKSSIRGATNEELYIFRKLQPEMLEPTKKRLPRIFNLPFETLVLLLTEAELCFWSTAFQTTLDCYLFFLFKAFQALYHNKKSIPQSETKNAEKLRKRNCFS